MLIGIYLGQFCITTLTYFFITWFPIYLVQARHMSVLRGGFAVAVPALCGSVGGVLGGVCSDSSSASRIFAHLCTQGPDHRRNAAVDHDDRLQLHRLQSVVMFLMSLAFFGKGFGALGWTVIADTSPRELIGLNGGIFNLFGNTAGDHHSDCYRMAGEEDRFIQ